jgi:hypothetical protein
MFQPAQLPCSGFFSKAPLDLHREYGFLLFMRRPAMPSINGRASADERINDDIKWLRVEIEPIHCLLFLPSGEIEKTGAAETLTLFRRPAFACVASPSRRQT